jgi:hydroxyacylglutathione hydrolase
VGHGQNAPRRRSVRGLDPLHVACGGAERHFGNADLNGEPPGPAGPGGQQESRILGLYPPGQPFIAEPVHALDPRRMMSGDSSPLQYGLRLGTKIESMLSIEPLHAFRDNYIWALAAGETAVVVDPGDAAPVEAWLDRTGHRLIAILVTHHHPDHVGGLGRLKTRYRPRTYGPAGEDIPGVDSRLGDGDAARPAEGFPDFAVIAVPGHTAGHIAYYGDGLLFCGDTLFSGGCGRLFEGTAGEMFASLRRLAALPPETRVYPAHEYTVANLRFARAVLPEDDRIEKALAKASEIVENGHPTLPSTLAQEKTFNVFLRTGEEAVRKAAERMAGQRLENETQVFAALRLWKDRF